MNTPATNVKVRVEYGLAEYKQVLREFIPLHMAEQAEKPNRLLPWNWPIVESALFFLVVPPIFWWKKAMIGNCVFTFTADGLTRTTKRGTDSREWDQVKAVHRLSGAYLLELKAGGAMPVPYRVFISIERTLFERFARIEQSSAA